MLSEFVAEIEKNSYLLISANVIEAIQWYRQFEHSPESGGILLGTYRDQHIEITHLTEPGPRDKQTRFSFYRKDQIHQSTAEKLWKESGGIITYIGEWHTHPQINPKPSRIDFKEWGQGLPNRPMITFIMGDENYYVGYTHHKKRNRIFRNLSQIN